MTLADISEFIVDCEHKTAPTQADGYPSIRTPNIGKGYFILDGVNRVSEETYRLWTKRAVPAAGDIIMAREAPVGSAAIIPEGLQPCLGQRTLLIRPDRKKVEPAFLNYLLNGPQVQEVIHAKTNGVTVPHLNMKDVRELSIPELPTMAVQRRIAGVLFAYDELIENNQRRIRILEEMARALYRAWFVEFRFPGHVRVSREASPLGEIPKGWKVRKLGEILKLQYGKALKQEDRREGAVPVYGSSGIVGSHDVAHVSGPGIVVGRKGNVGSVFWSDKSFYPIDTVYFVESELPLRFLYHNLKTKTFLNSDAAVPGLNRTQAHSMETVVPSLDLITRFHEIADGFGRHGSLLQAQCEELWAMRELTLPRLMKCESFDG